MSLLQNDREILNNRKTPTDQEPAKLFDQTLEQLRQQLEDQDISSKVRSILTAGDSQRQLWLERQKDFLNEWDEFLQPNADGPFEGSSNLRVPATLIVVKALHARFMQAIMGIYPWVSIEARKEAYVASQDVVTDVIQHYLDRGANRGVGVRRTLDQWLWNWITAGSAFLAQRWECEYEEFVDVVTEYVPSLEIIDGKEMVIPKATETEKKVNKKIFEGPVWEIVFPEDVLIIGGDGDINNADSVHRFRWVTESDLFGNVDRKIFNKDAVEETIESGADWRPGLALNSDIKHQRAFDAGSTRLWTEANLDRYEIVESYIKMDVHGTGMNSKIVVWTHRRSGKVLGATYLRRINQDGLLPIQKIDFHIRPGETYGVGVPEMMYPIATELTAHHNMTVDNGILTNMPFGFYRASSSINPKEIAIRPGVLMPLDNPQEDINFPQMGNKTSFGAQEEASLWNYVEKLFGVNDLSLGVTSGSQGATRTASGVQALQGESNINLNVPLSRLNEGWTRALNYLLSTLQRRIPEGLAFKVSADENAEYFRHIRTSQDIAGDFDIKVSGNTADSNKSVQQQNADTVMQIASNPMYIQMGIVHPTNTYEAIKTSLKVRGIKNFAQFITKPEEAPPILPPGQEVGRIIEGQQVPIDLRQDHQGYLDLFKHITSSPELMGSLSKEQVVALAAQAQKHQQALQALQGQAAQAANSQQMQQNQAMSMRGPAPAAQAPSPGTPAPVGGAQQG